MSKISIEGNASGTGTLTIAAPNTNSNYTLTLPENTGTVVTTGGASSLTTSGNLTFTGTGNRITGDFTNTTIANRVMFQSSTTNGNTRVLAIPNGSAVVGQFTASNNSDPTNSATLSIEANSTESALRAGIIGTGTYLPMTFYTGGSERMRIDTSGNLLVGTTTAIAFVTVNADIAQNSIPSAVVLNRYKQFFYENSSLADDHTAIVLAGSLTSGFIYYTCAIEVVVSNGDTIETAATIWVDSKETTVTSTNLGGINSTNIAVVNGTTGTDNKFNICCNSQNGSSYLAIRNRMGGSRRAYVAVRIISTR